MSESTGNQNGQGGEYRPVVVRGRITSINAEKLKDGPITGIELNIEFDRVIANGRFLEVWFVYHARYKEEIGLITLGGFLMFDMEEETAKRIEKRFSESKDFEPGFAEAVINNINYKCSTDAIFPARILDLTAPIIPPRVGLKVPPGSRRRAAEEAAAEKAAQENPQGSAKTGPQAPQPRTPGLGSRSSTGQSYPFGTRTPPPFDKKPN